MWNGEGLKSNSWKWWKGMYREAESKRTEWPSGQLLLPVFLCFLRIGPQTNFRGVSIIFLLKIRVFGSLQTNLLSMVGELAGGGSAALAVDSNDIWQVTGDTQHLTGDTWHVTGEMWHIPFLLYNFFWCFLFLLILMVLVLLTAHAERFFVSRMRDLYERDWCDHLKHILWGLLWWSHQHPHDDNVADEPVEDVEDPGELLLRGVLASGVDGEEILSEIHATALVSVKQPGHLGGTGQALN